MPKKPDRPPNNPPDPWTHPAAHRPGHILPPEREVDCKCDPRLERPILRDPTGWNNRITACLRCGKVSLTESLTEEPHPHDVQCVGNKIEAVAPDVLAWLSAWPRLAWGVWQQDRSIYLPAALRCQSAEELQRLERDALAQQQHLTPAERLQSIGFPDAPPPPGLPERMQTFAQTQAGLRLTRDTDLETLLSHASRSDWAMPFAYQHLQSRPDFTSLVVTLLANPDPDRRSAGITLVQHGHLKDPEVVAAVVALLEQTSLDHSAQPSLETLLNTLYDIGPAASAARPLLQGIAQRIGASDYYRRKRVEQICDLIK